MEEVIAGFFEFFGQACCEIFCTTGADILAFTLGWKSHKVKKETRLKGQEPTQNVWGLWFKIVLPVALAVTLLFLGTLALKVFGPRNL
jgi:hypothetical protein